MNIGIDVRLLLSNAQKIDEIVNEDVSCALSGKVLKNVRKQWKNYFQENIEDIFCDTESYICRIYVFLPYSDFKLLKSLLEQVLQEKKIRFDEVICCEEKYKNDLIRNRNMHYVMSDKFSFFQGMEEDISCLFIGKWSENIGWSNIRVFKEINMAFSYIARQYDAWKKQIEDPITVVSQIPSVDKMWMRGYSIDQMSVKVNRNMNLCDYIYSNVCNNLESTAIIYFDKRISFRQLFWQIDAFAIELKRCGVRQEEVVGICMPNTPEAVISIMSILKVGAIPLLLHPLLKGNEIKRALCKTKAAHMVVSDVSEGEVYKIISDTNIRNVFVASVSLSMPMLLKVVYTMSSIKNIWHNKRIFNKERNGKWEKCSRKRWNIKANRKKILDNGEKTVESFYKSNSTAFLLMTGGTTGSPKLTMLSSENCIANIEQLKYTIPFYKPFDVIEGVIPLFHGFGLVDTILTGWAVNLAVDLHPKYNPKRFARAILKNRPVLILGVPTLFKSIIQNKIFNGKEMGYLKVWISGGDILDADLREKINGWRREHRVESPIFSGIGLTESTAAIAFTGMKSKYDRSVGFPLPCNEIKIVSVKDGHELGYGEVGELCVCGPTVMKGYFDEKKETEQVLKEENGKLWLHTGDICCIMPNGEIQFVDRNKGIIVVSGINVYRKEIEEIIYTLEAVKECAVIGVPHPYSMNVPKAFVVLEDGKCLDATTKQRFIRYCNEKMDKYHRIFDMEQINALPRTNMQKVDYLQLEKWEKEKSKGI